MNGFWKKKVEKMNCEIVRIRREDIGKLDAASFLDIERIEKELLSDTVVYIAFAEGEPAGIITLEHVGAIYRTSYFFVAEKFRKKGVGNALMKAVRSYDPKIYINDDMGGYETMLSAFSHMGFDLIREENIYSFERTEETIEVCMDMMNSKGLQLMDMLRRHGYGICRMKTADSGIIERLGEEIGDGYDESMNPFNVKDIDMDWSYIVVKDGFPVAFIVCVTKDDILYIEQLCAHDEYKRQGAAMLAMLTVIERLMIDRNVLHVRTAVRKGNNEMTHIVDEKLKNLIRQVRQAKVYALK